MPRLIITSGRIIDPANTVDQTGDVVVENGRVISAGPRVKPKRDDDVLDAAGLIVCPGLIDPHVHLREPGGEDAETIATGAAAAINGGFTTVCCMPNTNPTIDNASIVGFILRQAERAAQARVFPVGAATRGRKGEELADILSMAREGAVGFSDDGDAVASAGMMRRVLRQVAAIGRAFMQHCQEPTLTEGASMNAGATATRLGLVGWPSVAEEIIIERDIRLNRDIGCAYHVQHMSAAGSVEIVRRARAEGQPVTAEAAPHHLLLTDDACDGYDTNAKMNPPLRSAADVEALRHGVADGTISVLATDHAPHTSERKSLEFEAAPFGIIGVECALPLYVKALVEPGHIDWPRLIELLTINPARLCGLDEAPWRLGALTPGAPADITVIDPDEEWTIDVDQFVGKTRNTPFHGWTVRGRATAVIVGGEIRLDRAGRVSSLRAAVS